MSPSSPSRRQTRLYAYFHKTLMENLETIFGYFEKYFPGSAIPAAVAEWRAYQKERTDPPGRSSGAAPLDVEALVLEDVILFEGFILKIRPELEERLVAAAGDPSRREEADLAREALERMEATLPLLGQLKEGFKGKLS